MWFCELCSENFRKKKEFDQKLHYALLELYGTYSNRISRSGTKIYTFGKSMVDTQVNSFLSDLNTRGGVAEIRSTLISSRLSQVSIFFRGNSFHRTTTITMHPWLNEVFSIFYPFFLSTFHSPIHSYWERQTFSLMHYVSTFFAQEIGEFFFLWNEYYIAWYVRGVTTTLKHYSAVHT